ncbi:hypothetical protein SAMN05421595_1955 [Austwickia chelonae]|uniref:Uncharacterized protein n=1 Tax=Austwickia chelonae NBRC 105200 TaxID=1184607 RepID=K6VN60_9MICO|nr:hypothetical protein [Austwickia chelonae]GAB76820.1 hypothetical protein AUCHE_03_00370 [Austwickia chelonae NBRC 105200]SEW31130.1 hypothetical protein SAMN05421595_1955 [Austwickia chelonae]
MSDRDLQRHLSPLSSACCAEVLMPAPEEIRRRGDRRRRARGTTAVLAAVLVTVGGLGLLDGRGGGDGLLSGNDDLFSDGMSAAASPVPATGEESPRPDGSAPVEEDAAGRPRISLDPMIAVRVEAVVDGLFGSRFGTISGGFDDGVGRLPYVARVATTALSGSSGGGRHRTATAVGVDVDGRFRLTVGGAGRPVVDRFLPLVGGAEVTAMAASTDRGGDRLSVLCFLRSGKVRQVVVEEVGVGSVPRVSRDEVVASGAAEVFAVVSAGGRAEPDGHGRVPPLYAVVGDRLVLLTVAADGRVSSSPLRSAGLGGTTTLGRLDGHGQGVHGVVVWKGVGPGMILLGRDPSGPFGEAGEAGALHR